MKKTILLFGPGLVLLSLFVLSQDIQHEAVAINIEVPVRVYDGDRFIEGLTLEDFELLENDVVQRLDAVYLIKENKIRRRDEKKRFSPETARHFYLFFEVSEYTPRMGEAIEYFVRNVLSPLDTLNVITPLKSYRMRSETLQALSKEKIFTQLKSLLRKDAETGGYEYRALVDEIASVARTLTVKLGESEGPQDDLGAGMFEEFDLELLLPYYRTLLERIENIRQVDQKKLLDFAGLLKEETGQKNVFLFYQREFIPMVDQRILTQSASMFQGAPEIEHNLIDLFDFTKRDLNIDVNLIKQSYADSSIAIHFLFFSKPAEDIPNVRMVEHSEDIFNAFNEIARATGGLVTSSANPQFLFARASEATENYYLLYYSPRDYRTDGTFKNISVRIKSKDYRVIHRAGYLAD